MERSWANLVELKEYEFISETKEDPNYELPDFQLSILKAQRKKEKQKSKSRSRTTVSKKAGLKLVS